VYRFDRCHFEYRIATGGWQDLRRAAGALLGFGWRDMTVLHTVFDIQNLPLDKIARCGAILSDLAGFACEA